MTRKFNTILILSLLSGILVGVVTINDSPRNIFYGAVIYLLFPITMWTLLKILGDGKE